MSRVKDMAHYAVDALSQEKWVVFITSTYGNGEPPDDAAPFWRGRAKRRLDTWGEIFRPGAGQFHLRSLQVRPRPRCGFGAPRRHAPYPRVDCDVDYDVPAKRWTEVIASLRRDHGASAAT